jgi:MYXO-CTERM domain-containing protein
MQTGIAVVVSLLATSAAVAGGIPDSLIYGQNPLAQRGYESSVFPGAASPSVRIADSVNGGLGLPLPSRVFRIDWWGGASQDPGFDLSNIESFNIRAYSLFGGGIFYEDTIAVGALDVELEFENAGSSAPAIYRYSYQSNQGRLFNGGELEYISIAANYADGSFGAARFLWAQSSEGDIELLSSENGGEFLPLTVQNPNVAYALYGAIPTPGAFALLGLAGLTAARRRRSTPAL